MNLPLTQTIYLGFLVFINTLANHFQTEDYFNERHEALHG
jgi:hypothetical protein